MGTLHTSLVVSIAANYRRLTKYDSYPTRTRQSSRDVSDVNERSQSREHSLARWVSRLVFLLAR